MTDVTEKEISMDVDGLFDFTENLLRIAEDINSDLTHLCEEFDSYEEHGQSWFKSKFADTCHYCKEGIDFTGDGVYLCNLCGTEWDISVDEFYRDELGHVLYTHQVVLPTDEDVE